MCGRMVVFSYDEVVGIVQAIQAGPDNPYPDWPARRQPPQDAFPQMTVPLVVPSVQALERLEIQELTWGYPVQWREWPVYNTRIETLAKGDAFWRESMDRRCLVPTRAFYERHATETVRSPKTGRKVKSQYAFTLVDEEVTWLAAIREDDHFSVVTTEPNAYVAPVHDRMPLVLRRNELEQWLGDEWQALADRSGIRLDVQPEVLPPLPLDDGQMTLF